MAKEVVGSITSAVAGAVADRAVDTFVDNLGKQRPVADKLQRLERLCMRIRSTVEVSEKHDIESASLLQWQEKLKEAVALGDEVLLSLQQQATPTPTTTDAQGTSTTGTCTTAATALSFTRKALSNMARRIGGAVVTAFFSSDEDAKKLESAVEALEKASENLGEFIGLLQLEASPRLKKRRYRYVRESRSGGRQGCGRGRGRNGSSDGTRGDWELHQEVAVLVGRLQEALAKISTAVDTAEVRYIQGMELEWLAQWVVLLREAKQQGHTVLHSLRAELPEYDHEEDELRSFVQTVEGIAGDLVFFDRLITSFCDILIFQFIILTMMSLQEVAGS